jgi:nucleotide-binding universal stress UspA family protein
VVVGIDGSIGSAVALRWAMDHADRLGRVVPVATFLSGPFEYGFGTSAGIEATGEPYRSETVLRLAEFLQEHAPSLAGDGVVIEHRAGPGLLEAAADSELLVVGTRGWGIRSDPSSGSVAAYCARHAQVPVALIPRDVPAVDEQLDVVVGLDGSPNAAHALSWSLHHLRQTARVTALRAVTVGPVVGDPLAVPSKAAIDTAHGELEEDVAKVVAELDGHAGIELLVVNGDPRDALGTAVADADVLVVGTRGHGAVHRLLLGSVSTALAHHPTLPTIVVPPERS